MHHNCSICKLVRCVDHVHFLLSAFNGNSEDKQKSASKPKMLSFTLYFYCVGEDQLSIQFHLRQPVAAAPRGHGFAKRLRANLRKSRVAELVFLSDKSRRRQVT